MNLDIATIDTADLIAIANILATTTFSFLVWKATVASNKTALAIKEAAEKEKQETDNQNRFIVNYNLTKIENVLLSHSVESGFKRDAKPIIFDALEKIKKFPLSSYYNEAEIKSILDFVSYMEDEFSKVFRKAKAYSVNPLYADDSGWEKIRQERQEYNRKDVPQVEKAIIQLENVYEIIK